jgi:hydroxyethylthiazole kinase-like sugar kinase family protein
MIQDLARRLRANIQTVIVGKDEVIDQALAAVLCEGHVLLEDVLGIGKMTLARACDCPAGLRPELLQDLHAITQACLLVRYGEAPENAGIVNSALASWERVRRSGALLCPLEEGNSL